MDHDLKETVGDIIQTFFFFTNITETIVVSSINEADLAGVIHFYMDDIYMSHGDTRDSSP